MSTTTATNVPSNDATLNNIQDMMNNQIPSSSSNSGPTTPVLPANIDVVDLQSNSNPTQTYVNPLYLSVVMIGLIIIVTVIVYLGGFNNSNEQGDISSSTNQSNNSIGNILIKIIFVSAVVLLLVYIVQYMLFYYFGIDISASISKLFEQGSDPKVNINVNETNKKVIPQPEPEPQPIDPTPVSTNEVFNIPDNTYTYDDAKLLCKAYDSELATYQQVESSYKKGGEWCNYGWSADQLALFPTQQKTYDGLQDIPGHKHDCGRPGINGGYIANPNVRFGVNCYGTKPKITKQEEDALANATPYPKTAAEKKMEEQVNEWKGDLDSITVSPFNYAKWNA
jgi:hypothetical protein